MKTKELRIGNWINTIEGHAQVKAMSEKGLMATPIMDGGDLLVWAKPIPLTEGWLLKLGFYRQGSVMFLGVRYQRYTLGRNSLYSIDGKSFIYDVNDHDLCEINYVHQLQNLYFALTNTELTIS